MRQGTKLLVVACAWCVGVVGLPALATEKGSGAGSGTAAVAAIPDGAEVARQARQLLESNYPSVGPGAAVLVMRGKEVLFRGARGEADIAGHVPLSPAATFRIGSLTKQFSAAGLLLLVQDGKVSLDDPLSRFLPDYPNGAAITVRELLNHTSGVKSYTGIPGYMVDPIRKDLTTAQLVAVFKDLPVDFAPGQGWAYNNSGYVLVGAVIEAVTGEPWYRFLDQRLFKPLGMAHTGYGADPEFVARQVQGYTREGDAIAPAPPLSMTQPHAAGALLSTVDDLQTWNRALHEGRVLQSATYRQMITPTGKATEAEYGFGLNRQTLHGRDAIAHGGGINGFSTVLAYLPGPDIGVVVLQNTDDNGRGQDPEAVARRLAAIALGDPYPAGTPIAVDAAVLKQVEGVYRVDADIKRVLRVVNGALTSQRSGGQRSTLTPIAAGTFLYPDGFNRLVLERDGSGRVTAMRFFPDGEGEGVVAPRTDQTLPAERTAIALPAATLQRLAGTYRGNQGLLRVVVEGSQLKVQLQGQPELSLKAESATRFFPEDLDATVEFSPSQSEANAVSLTLGGDTLQFTRVAQG